MYLNSEYITDKHSREEDIEFREVLEAISLMDVICKITGVMRCAYACELKERGHCKSLLGI